MIEESPAVTSVQVTALTTSGLSFSGQNGRANTIQIDGVDNNDIIGNGVRPTISQEAVNEFQINRNAYNAEFGRAAGGIINIVSKSGTNQFHGNVYNFFRNERLDARNTFATGQLKLIRHSSATSPASPSAVQSCKTEPSSSRVTKACSGATRLSQQSCPTLLSCGRLQATGFDQHVDRIRFADSRRARARTSGPAHHFAEQSVPFAKQRESVQRFVPRQPQHIQHVQCFERGIPDAQNASTASLRIDHGLSEQDFVFFRYSLTNDSQNNIGVGGLVAPSGAYDIGIETTPSFSARRTFSAVDCRMNSAPNTAATATTSTR